MNKTVKLSVWDNPSYMKANDRERMEAFICEYDGECPAYAQGHCVCENLFLGWIKCPHAKHIRQTGLTKRAKNFGEASARWRELYKTDIVIANEKLCQCGDYIYLPYPHLDAYGSKPIQDIVADYFLHKSLFTVENIRRIMRWQPRALMGGIIESFQEKEIPKFICHLHEVFPDLYAAYLKTYPDDKERFEATCVNYVGRKAYLNTLNDGTTYKDCHGNVWIKDGKYLVCEQMDTSIHMVVGKKPRRVMQQIVGDEIIAVTKNEDVSENTIFAE